MWVDECNFGIYKKETIIVSRSISHVTSISLMLRNPPWLFPFAVPLERSLHSVHQKLAVFGGDSQLFFFQLDWLQHL